MKVLAIHMAKAGLLPTACQIYRTNQPLNELHKHGHTVEWLYYDDLADLYRTSGQLGVIAKLSAFDLIVLPRVAVKNEDQLATVTSFLTLVRKLGKRVVYEVDDDFSNQYRDLGFGDAMTVASWCDAITVTTPMLADLMRRKTKRPVYVLPNCVDSLVWKRPLERFPGPLRIGLSGSKTHGEDWRVLADVLPGIVRDLDVEVLLAAYHPDYLLEMERTSYLEGMDYLSYAQYVKHCDIVLAPVDPHDGFNLGKSPIKAIEGMAAAREIDGRIVGAAVIATDNPVYRLAVEHGKTGLLVNHTPEAWDTALRTLINDNEIRARLQHDGFHATWRQFDIAKNWTLWARAYQSILAKPMNSVKLPLAIA